MTVSELEILYKYLADDGEGTNYRLGFTNFLLFLNEAQRKAVRNANLIFDKTSATTTKTVVAGTSIYSLDASIYAVVAATLDIGGSITTLKPTDRIEIDRVYPSWREQSTTPIYFIHGRNSIELIPEPNAAATLQLEVYRYPVALTLLASIPEIEIEHHEHLVDWVLYRAFSTKDADSVDIAKAMDAKNSFLSYFGQEPRANTRKEQYQNKPHRNKAAI